MRKRGYFINGDICEHEETVEVDPGYYFCTNCKQTYNLNNLEPGFYLNGRWVNETEYDDFCQMQVDQKQGN